MFLSETADKILEKKLKNSNKIGEQDVDTFYMGNDGKNTLKLQKAVWHKKEMKYKKMTFKADGSLYDPARNLKKISKTSQSLNKTFKKWKKANAVTIQKDGALLDKNQSGKFKTMF